MTNENLLKMDLYQILGIRREATIQEIKRAYKNLALKCHPDKNRSPEAGQTFQLIGAAYGILSDSVKKNEYDSRYSFINPSYAKSQARPKDKPQPIPQVNEVEKLIRNLSIIPQGKRLNTLFNTDINGDTFLHRMNSRQVTKVFQHLLPKEEYLSALRKKNNKRLTVLDTVFKNMSLDVVNKLLLLLNQKDRYLVLRETSLRPKDLPLSDVLSIEILLHSYPRQIGIQEIIQSNRFHYIDVDQFEFYIPKLSQDELLKIAEAGIYKNWTPYKQTIFFQIIIVGGFLKEKLQAAQYKSYCNDLLAELFTEKGFRQFQKTNPASEQIDVLFMLSTMRLTPRLFAQLNYAACELGLFAYYEHLERRPKEVISFISKGITVTPYIQKNIFKWLLSLGPENIPSPEYGFNLIGEAISLLARSDQQKIIKIKDLIKLAYSSKNFMAIILDAFESRDRFEICTSVEFQQQIHRDPSWFIIGLGRFISEHYSREDVKQYSIAVIEKEGYFQRALTCFAISDNDPSSENKLLAYLSQPNMLEIIRKNPLSLSYILVTFNNAKLNNEQNHNYIKNLFNSSTWELAAFKTALNEVTKAQKLNWALDACNSLFCSKPEYFFAAMQQVPKAEQNQFLAQAVRFDCKMAEVIIKTCFNKPEEKERFFAFITTKLYETVYSSSNRKIVTPLQHLNKESIDQIVQTFYSKDQYALHNALFNKLVALSKRANVYSYHGLFKHIGAFSREEKIEAITKFLKKEPLSDLNKKALLQGETGKIFRQHKTQEIDSFLKNKDATQYQRL